MCSQFSKHSEGTAMRVCILPSALTRLLHSVSSDTERPSHVSAALLDACLDMCAHH